MTPRVFPSGVRQLPISNPTTLSTKAVTLCGNIILVAKFDFTAESADELSVAKGDVLKLLDKLPNGWVLVESIDKVATSGLVPSLYVDIAVNDASHPITTLWLHLTQSQSAPITDSTFNNVQVQMLLKQNSPLTINNRPYPLTANVVCYLACDDRFWYRVDVSYSTGEWGYLCRYYLDFFDLHVALLDYVAAHEVEQLTAAAHGALLLSLDISVDLPPLTLPHLPEPITNLSHTPAQQSALFSKRVKELSSYLGVLVADKRLQASAVLADWVNPAYNGQPGFAKTRPLNDSHEAIAQRIVPHSRIVASLTKTRPPKASELSKLADASCYLALPRGVQRAKSLSHAQPNLAAAAANAALYRSPSVRSPRKPQSAEALSRTRTRTISHANATHSAKVLGSSFEAPSPLPVLPRSMPPTTIPRTQPRLAFAPPPHAPLWRKLQLLESPPVVDSALMDSPVLGPQKPPNPLPPMAPWAAPAQGKTQLLRCEIKTQVSDLIVVKLNQADFHTFHAFRALLSRKVRFQNFYVKLNEADSYEELEPYDQELFGRIKQMERIFILIT
ncbi:hypothetical protein METBISCDRAFT_25756 [Metschnikowia bicuspidata]|uniref:SH3 domain-containing protein n=1 Tax=Metschnikowia bicuspidata TaxID=27322 RepID=A0A4P9ZHA2_9ASCO|nr:hypothetical protein METBISCDRAFT_25756 [Metschnikowia bicuspidata]